MKIPVNPITLQKVISERMESDEVISKEGYIDSEYGKTLYLDSKGLVHKDGPEGKIVDYVGWTGEQKARLKDPDSIAPMLR
jgi:hypothetical protein